MWVAGKVHQRLGDFSMALKYFTRGLEVRPGQPDLAIEAALAAIQLGHGEQAERFARIAVKARPEDAGHRADLALALLVAGKADEAKLTAEEALRLAPGDGISQILHRIICLVIKEDLPHPKSIHEVQQIAKTHGITNAQGVPPRR